MSFGIFDRAPRRESSSEDAAHVTIKSSSENCDVSAVEHNLSLLREFEIVREETKCGGRLSYFGVEKHHKEVGHTKQALVAKVPGGGVLYDTRLTSRLQVGVGCPVALGSCPYKGQHGGKHE